MLRHSVIPPHRLKCIALSLFHQHFFVTLIRIPQHRWKSITEVYFIIFFFFIFTSISNALIQFGSLRPQQYTPAGWTNTGIQHINRYIDVGTWGLAGISSSRRQKQKLAPRTAEVRVRGNRHIKEERQAGGVMRLDRKRPKKDLTDGTLARKEDAALRDLPRGLRRGVIPFPQGAGGVLLPATRMGGDTQKTLKV